MIPLRIFRSGSYILHYTTFGLAMLTWSIIIIMSFVRTIMQNFSNVRISVKLIMQITSYQRGTQTYFFTIPRFLAIFFMASMSCQYCSLSAYSERLRCDWLEQACLFSSTQPRREEPGAGVSPRVNFPVNRPLIVSTMDGVEIKKLTA